MLGFPFKEFVTCSTKSLPKLIGGLVGDGTDFFPFPLQGNEFIHGLLPFCTFCHGFGLDAEFGLELQVVVLFLFQ